MCWFVWNCICVFVVCMCSYVCTCVYKCMCGGQMSPWLEMFPWLVSNSPFETGFHIHPQVHWLEHTESLMTFRLLLVSGPQHRDLEACSTMCCILQRYSGLKTRSTHMCSSHFTIWNTIISFFLFKCVGGGSVYFLVVKNWYLEWGIFNKEDIYKNSNYVGRLPTI